MLFYHAEYLIPLITGVFDNLDLLTKERYGIIQDIIRVSLSNEEFLEKVLWIQQLDNSIRFVGIANSLGSLIATAYRNRLTPLMNEQETSHYGIQLLPAGVDYKRSANTSCFCVCKNPLIILIFDSQ